MKSIPSFPYLLSLLVACSTTAVAHGQSPEPARFPRVFRSVDGSGNNLSEPKRGAADTILLRLTRADYGDGLRAPAGASRLSARMISNLCAEQTRSIVSEERVSSFVWQWGQFLDHDLSLTVESSPEESLDIAVPAADPWFDPEGAGERFIAFKRSAYRVREGVRQQTNALSAFIDGSQIYGSDIERAHSLRTFDGSGRLQTSGGDLLPFNDSGFANAPSGDASFFLAGDVRANEQVGLTALHIVFVREHNHWAARISDSNPELQEEEIYQWARAMVIAELQAITVREFLPVFLGPEPLPRYAGYDPTVDAGISNEFATAAFRVGHSMLPPQLLRLDGEGSAVAEGHLSLSAAFFAPSAIIDHGVDALLRGLAVQPAQEVDPHIVDEVRNFLFGRPGDGGFDLASLNVQRGRDHGLPGYNHARTDLGLIPVATFADINPDPAVQENLSLAFESVDNIDLWMGGLSERHAAGGLVGETFRTILVDQFRRLRDGDRFWYQTYMSPALVAFVETQTLATILRRTTGLGAELSDDVFRVP